MSKLNLFIFISFFKVTLFQLPLALACPIHGHKWHLDDQYDSSNRYQITVDDPIRSSMTKEDFQRIPNEISAIYEDDFKSKGIEVLKTFYWEKPYFSAWANKEEEGVFSINFWGGFSRIPGMTRDGYALVACHEIGHIMGGWPKVKIERLSWATSEGQSDYYATGRCLKRYFKRTTKVSDHLDIESTPQAYTLCRLSYENDLDFSICLRSAQAADSFAKVLNYLSEHDLELSTDNESPHIAEQTIYNSYPEQQCRIDTLLSGALCEKEEFPCTKGLGKRPSCWFAY